MTGKFLLDTNVLIAILRGDIRAAAALRQVESFAISAIALGELDAGAFGSKRVTENLASVERLAAEQEVLACDQDTARMFGAIRKSLRLSGRPIPENDIWIAATAVQHGFTLVTRDLHFKSIDGLNLVEW